jgi:hypothetical protein
MSSFDDSYSAYRSEVEGRAPQLSDWAEGSANDGYGGGAARLAELLSVEIARRFLAKWFATATGSEIDALAADLFGAEAARGAAAQATITLALSRASATAGNVAIGTSQVIKTDLANAEDAVQFRPVIAYTLIGLGPLAVQCRAVTAGKAGNVAIGASWTADPPLSDQTVVIANAAKGAGGDDAWSDDRYKAWLYDYVKTLARGTVLALITGAKSVPGVAAAAVDESDAGPDDGGLVRLLVGDVDGNATDLLKNAVTAALEAWRGAGIRVEVVKGTRTDVTGIGIVVRMRSTDYDSGAVTADAQTAGSQAVEDMAPDERLYQERLDAAVYAALGGAEKVSDVASTHSGGWPVVPGAGRSLRLAETAITVTALGPEA